MIIWGSENSSKASWSTFVGGINEWNANTGDGGEAVLGAMPIGAVPVRYVTGETDNVVPVVTVLTNEVGTVPVREMVGPEHVVPVREVTLDVQHVTVRKV